MHNGKAQYCCSGHGSGILGSVTKEEAMAFAEKAWADLKDATFGAFLGDGVTRVDLMVNHAGEIKVNEIESLDANFSASAKSEALTRQFIIDYYCTFLQKMLVFLL